MESARERNVSILGLMDLGFRLIQIMIFLLLLIVSILGLMDLGFRPDY